MIYLVNGMADKHAQAAEKRIAGILAAKWTLQYSQMVSFVRTWMCLGLIKHPSPLRGPCDELAQEGT